MPSIVFSNIVADPAASNPESLNLTTKNNGVTAVSFGSNAKAILFNAESTQTGSNNCNFLVNGATTQAKFASSYNGKTVALLLNNGESFTYTLNTSQLVQTASANNSFDSVGPEKQRLWNLNG